jgi:hypothetical protein
MYDFNSKILFFIKKKFIFKFLKQQKLFNLKCNIILNDGFGIYI